MKPGDLGIVADLDLSVRQLAELLDRFDVGRSHVGSRNDTQLAALLGELRKLTHNQAQSAPLDERHQHINAVAGDDFFLELRVHLRLMYRTGEQ